MTTPNIVSKRNQFTPADEFVEDAMPYLPEQFKHDSFRAWLLRYTETVIKGVAYHFSTAADKGIQQAADLLCDPEFYETRKKRRAEQKRSWKEQEAKQEWERIEKQHCPTAEQITQQIKSCTGQVAYHTEQLEKYKAALEHWQEMTPKNIRLIPKGIQ